MPTPVSPLTPLPAALTKAAELEKERFEREYAAQLAKAKESVSLTVLVWGPSPAAVTPASNKRKDICAELKKQGHNALFSEDISKVPGSDGLSEKSKEFAQAQAAHLIVILVEGAPGASAEAHDFTNHPDLAPKCCVMMPQEYHAGYSANGAIRDLEDGYGGVYWYKPDDLTACNVLTYAVRKAEARRQIIFRHKAEGV